jgi:hypothetical protein
MRKISIFILMFSMLAGKSIAQQVSLTGKVINHAEKPIKNVLVYLKSNPSLYCHSDSLGNFSLINLSTLVPEVRQNEIISFKNRKLSLHANNQPISIDVITMNGSKIMNILNINRSPGTIELYPEAYISGLPKAIYIVRARVGNTFQSFKIQNLISSSFSQGITQYNINNTIDNSFSEPQSESRLETKSGVLDTLVLVHDFYKSRKIPLDSYSIQYDTVHLNNFADYSIAEGFEPSVTNMYKGYGNFTDIISADSVRFIVMYDTLSILKGDLKVITIPIDKIESLDNSIKFISGLHFEPSGTKFFQTVQVYVFMKDSIPENLVVFHCNDQGETYYIPYKDLLNDGHSIIFNINHFSSIGIGTGKIPTKSDPAVFTTSDQFISYVASFAPNFDEVPEEIFSIWFNNVVAPMITKIITWDDFGAALGEFLLMAEYYTWLTGHPFTDLPFYGSAREMFCEKMMKIWNELIVEYKGLDDKCLKRAILDIALSILEQNALLGGWCTDLSHPNLSDMNVFGSGEFFNLANKIEFSTPVKHLEVGQSYAIQYTLKSISGNTLPEVVIWSSSNPLVATIDANGKVIALKEGVTTIKGKICDIENTFKVEVGENNCELNYCINKNGRCYSGIYKGTGVLNYYSFPLYANSCFPEVYDNTINLFTIEVDLTGSHRGYFKITSFTEDHKQVWDVDNFICVRSAYGPINSTEPDPFFYCLGIDYFVYGGLYKYGYNIAGHLMGDLLILDVKVTAHTRGGHRIFATKIYCARTDK